MKTEKPILFSGPLVRAILEGRKTETRRIIKPAFWKGLNPEKFGPGVTSPDGRWKSPYGERGDELWVRETFFVDDVRWCPRGPLPKSKPDADIYYRADGECCDQVPECQCWDAGGTTWRPSIHMPRWASRIQLRVVEVRFERLQDIDGDGARAEGIESHDDDGVTYYGPFDHGHADPHVAFRQLWDGINAKRGFGWNVNPWVWVVRFEVML